MNKILFGIAAVIVSACAIASPVSANNASGNVGSIVKVSDSCENMGSVASNNVGSIVKIDGGGQCDINEIMKSPAVKNNVGSIIKISNVCGNTEGVSNNNVGSIIKIDSNGPCKKNKPTTVVITPEDDKPKHEKPEHEKPESPADDNPKEDDTPKEQPKEDAPKEIPSTGPASVLAGIAGASSLGYGIHAYTQSRRKLAEALNR